MDIDEYAWIKASEYREMILLALEDKTRPPKELAEQTGYYLSHVSNTLADLEGHDLVECVTPGRRKGRLYSITDKGEQIARELRR